MAVDFFFYGTLLDADIRRLVLGPEADQLVPEAARLMGYHRGAVRGAAVPVIARQSGAAVEGLLARRVSAEGVTRLARYEGPDYRRISRRVITMSGKMARAEIFILARSRAARGGAWSLAAWSLAAWQRRHKRRYLRKVARWMAAARA